MLACGTLQCVVHSRMQHRMSFMLGLALVAALCHDSEECVYWCGKRCANDDKSVGDALQCVRLARRKGLSEHDRCRPDATAREYFRCVDDCHASSSTEEDNLSCAEAANARCHVSEYGAAELDALKAQCAVLVGIRDGCLGVDEEYFYNVTTNAVERMPKAPPTKEDRVKYDTPERRRLSRVLKSTTSPETARLDELIFLLDLYCWGGHGCDAFDTHRPEYDAFLAEYGWDPLVSRREEL